MAEEKEAMMMDPGKKARWFTIKKSMLPSKVAYFIYFSAWGCYLPFINIFLVTVGLTYEEAGFISGMCYAFQAVACPLWGFIADTTGQRRLCFIVLCLGSAAAVFSQPWVARKVNTDFFEACHLNTTASITTSNTTNMAATGTRDACVRKPFANTLFYVMMAMFILEQCLTGPLVSLLDSFIMNVVTSSSDPTSFGIQRVFGSIGFGVFSFLSGFTADNFDHTSLSKYSPVFFLSAPLFLIMIPIGCVLLNQTNWDIATNKNPDDTEDPMLDDESKVEKSQLELIGIALKNTRNLFFFLSVLFAGILFSVYWSFIFLLMDEKMNATKTAMGLTSLIASLSEIMMFPFSGKIINFLGSPLPGIELGILAFIARLTLLSYIENAWASLPVQLLHSICFALMWASAIEYVQSASSKAIYTTMFGILVSIMFGVAAVIGNMVGGILYNEFGGQALFRGTAVFAAVWLLIMILLIHVFKLVKLKIEDDDDKASSIEDVDEKAKVKEANSNEKMNGEEDGLVVNA